MVGVELLQPAARVIATKALPPASRKTEAKVLLAPQENHKSTGLFPLLTVHERRSEVSDKVNCV